MPRITDDGHVRITHPDGSRGICLNCKARATFKLCLDCWRMALITAALIGGGGETVHQLLEAFGLLGR